MIKIPRVVPWTSLEEFQQVHQWLYAESPNQREIGVKRVLLYLVFLNKVSFPNLLFTG